MLVNFYLVLDCDLYIILVFNKIDLFVVDLDCYVVEMVYIIGCELVEVLWVFGKIGEGVFDLFDEVV